MPKKAKSNRQALFEIIGGTNSIQTNSIQSNSIQSNSGQVTSFHGQNPTSAGFMVPQIDIFTSFLTMINSSPYMLSLAYLFLNLSGRFLTLELTKQQESFLAEKALRPIILFAVMFVATRNLAAAFWSTVIFLAIIWIFANENHALCLIPHWRKSEENKDKIYENNIKIIQKKEDNVEEDINTSEKSSKNEINKKA